MKILHVSNYFRGLHQHVGGAEQACFRTVTMTREHGHEVYLVTTSFDRSSLPSGESIYEYPVYPVKTFERYLPDVLVQYLEAVKWYTLQYDPLAGRAFKNILQQERPDVVHFHNFQFLTFSLLREAYRQRIPSCLSIYDYWPFCPKAMLLKPDNSFCQAAHGLRCVECLPQQFVPVQKALLSFRRRIFDRCFDKVDTFIVLSEHSAGVLQGYGIEQEKIAVVPLTLPIEYGQSSGEVPLEPQSILFAGWLNDRKGVHIAIEAMIDVLKDVPQAKLYVIGGEAKFSEEYERNFQKIIKEHQLSDHIIFLGHQKPGAVEQYLQRVAVLVIPEQYENMSPLIMIEGMLLGKPVVASNLGGIPEYIRDGETGFLADAYNPKEFAQKIITVLQHPETGERVGQAAKHYIQSRNNNEAIWERTLIMYQSTIERKAL